jgi:hypothetical protein
MHLITLITDGQRIRPLEIRYDPGYAQETPRGWTIDVRPRFKVVFPRQADGKPVLTPEMKKAYLEIADPNGKVRLPFNVKRMTVRGEVVY